VGVNSLLLSAAHGVPDVIALAATPTVDGIVRVPGIGGTAAFSVATVNVGAGGPIVATVDTGAASLPVSVFVCQTNPATGECITPLGPAASVVIGTGQTPTFAVFVVAHGSFVFDPAVNRVFIRFRDGSNLIRGASSVALLLL
jgi:hypothetical protein